MSKLLCCSVVLLACSFQVYAEVKIEVTPAVEGAEVCSHVKPTIADEILARGQKLSKEGRFVDFVLAGYGNGGEWSKLKPPLKVVPWEKSVLKSEVRKRKDENGNPKVWKRKVESIDLDINNDEVRDYLVRAGDLRWAGFFWSVYPEIVRSEEKGKVVYVDPAYAGRRISFYSLENNFRDYRETIGSQFFDYYFFDYQGLMYIYLFLHDPESVSAKVVITTLNEKYEINKPVCVYKLNVV